MARYDNAMTAHVWAQGRLSSGESNNGNFSFSGARIYSYRTVIGLRLPAGEVAVTSTSYSQTTSGKHMPAVNRAVRDPMRFPDLHGISDSLLALANYRDGERGKPPAHLESALRKYLVDHVAELNDKAGTYAYALLSPAGSWAAFKARELGKRAKAKERDAKRLRKYDQAKAAELAKIPLALVIERSWDQADSYRQSQLRDCLKLWRGYHVAAGGPRIKAAIWARLKAGRAVLKIAERHADSHGNNGRLTKTRAAISNLRRLQMGDYGRGGQAIAPYDALQLIPAHEILQTNAALIRNHGGHMPSATRARLSGLVDYATGALAYLEGEQETANRKRRAREDIRNTVRSLKAYRDADPVNGVNGPRPAHYYARIIGQIESFGESGRFPAIAARLAALIPELETARDTARDMAEERAKAARAEAERIAALSPDERRELWRKGDLPADKVRSDTYETGPLLRAINPELDGCRIIGGTLETSQGATVPLRHAFAVFAFVRDCRAKGLPWLPTLDTRGYQISGSHARHGPAHIRVGHFNVDSIAATGDFIAGCHSFKWPEIERLANRLGVFDCAPVALESADNA